MNTENLLTNLLRSHIVSAEAIRTLRRRIEQNPEKFGPQAVIEWLVDQGHITTAQGQRLLASADTARLTGASPEFLAEDVLDLAPLTSAQSPPTDVGDEPQLAPLDDEPARKRDVPPPAKPKKQVKSGKSSTAWSHEVAPHGTPTPSRGPLDDLFGPELGRSAARGSLSRASADGDTQSKESRSRNVWDSPFLLIGGGALLLLLIVGPLLWWRLARGSAEDALAAANKDYLSGAYAQAVAKYDLFLTGFPDAPGASEAKVRQGLARMRLAVNGGGDWTKVLDLSHEVLKEIVDEESFGEEGRKELAAMLPSVAEGLAKTADKTLDKKLVDESRSVLALVNRHVTKNILPVARMKEITASLELTEHKLNRDQELAKTLTAIDQHLATGDTGAAYAARNVLVGEYYDLESDDRLLAAVRKMSAADQSAVKSSVEPRPAVAAPPQSVTTGTVVLASTTLKENPQGVAGEVVYALAAGGLYALDAVTGQTLWRRFIGLEATELPLPVSQDAGADVIVLDVAAGGIVRLAAATGHEQWRQSLEDSVPGAPVLIRDQVLVASRGGRLLALNVESGELGRSTRLPQGLRVTPAIDPRGRLAYQVSEHSNLFVLSLADGTCPEIVYLAHAAGNVRVPPVTVSRYVIVAENNGAESSVLRVFLADDNGLNLNQVQSLRLDGHVLSPPQVSGRALFVATDRDALYSYEVAAPGSGDPLTETARKAGVDGPPTLCFPVVSRSQLYVAGHGMTGYDLESAQGRLSPRWVQDSQHVFTQPPRLVGDALFHVSVRRGRPGAHVSSVKTADGSRMWETRLALPLWGQPHVDEAGGRVSLLTQAGALFELRTSELAQRPVAAPSAAIAPAAEAQADGSGPAVLAGGRRAWFPGGDSQRVLIVEPEGSIPRVHWLAVPDAIAARPVAAAGGLVIPGRIGQVFLVSGETGQSLMEPFQSTLAAGETTSWSDPGLIDEQRILLGDGSGSVFLLEASTGSGSGLRLVKDVTTSSPLKGSVAVVGNTAYASNVAGRLVSFTLPDLAAGDPLPVLDRLAFGPMKVGSLVLAATSENQLVALNQRGLAWQVPLDSGIPAGATMVGDRLYLATQSGTIQRLATSDGRAEGEPLRLGEPIAAGPILLADSLCVIGWDGSVHVLQLP